MVACQRHENQPQSLVAIGNSTSFNKPNQRNNSHPFFSSETCLTQNARRETTRELRKVTAKKATRRGATVMTRPKEVTATIHRALITSATIRHALITGATIRHALITSAPIGQFLTMGQQLAQTLALEPSSHQFGLAPIPCLLPSMCS